MATPLISPVASPVSPPASSVPPSSSSWSHPDWEPLLSYSSVTSSWHCLVRPRGSDQGFTSFEPNGPGYPTPEAALSAASASVSTLLSVQEEASAVETVRLLVEKRLRAVETMEPGPAGGPPVSVTRWQAKGAGEGGRWTDPKPTPQEAMRTARRGSGSTSTPNSTSTSASTSANSTPSSSESKEKERG